MAQIFHVLGLLFIAMAISKIGYVLYLYWKDRNDRNGG